MNPHNVIYALNTFRAHFSETQSCKVSKPVNSALLRISECHFCKICAKAGNFLLMDAICSGGSKRVISQAAGAPFLFASVKHTNQVVRLMAVALCGCIRCCQAPVRERESALTLAGYATCSSNMPCTSRACSYLQALSIHPSTVHVEPARETKFYVSVTLVDLPLESKVGKSVCYSFFS